MSSYTDKYKSFQRNASIARQARASVPAMAKDDVLRMTWNQGDRDNLVKSIMPMCVKMASQISYSTGYSYEDLQSAAYLGAVIAADNFLETPVEKRVAKNGKFSTVAYFWIYKYIMQEIYENKSLLTHKRHHWKTVDTIAKVKSGDAPVGGEDDRTVFDTINMKTVDRDLARLEGDFEDVTRAITKLFGVLTAEEKRAISLFFGIDGAGRRTNKQVGAGLSVSVGKAHYLIGNALAKLRKFAESEEEKESVGLLAMMSGTDLAKEIDAMSVL